MKVHSSLSSVLRLLGQLASDLPIGVVLKKLKCSNVELFTYTFAALAICFSACWRKMETVGKLSGEPLSRGRHCVLFTGKYRLRQQENYNMLVISPYLSDSSLYPTMHYFML